MKTAISIPDPLYKAADRLAKKMHLSRSRLYATALDRYVKDHAGDEITKSLNAVYGEGKIDSRLPVDIAAMQFTSIGVEKW